MLFVQVVKRRKEQSMLETLTPIPENVETIQEKPSRQYSLLVKFLMENTPLLLAEGSHLECLRIAKQYYGFLKAEHHTHGTGMDFNAQLRGSDIITVIGTPKNEMFGGVRLWCTFEIREKVERTVYDENRSPWPPVATDKQPVLSSVVTDSDLRFNWE